MDGVPLAIEQAGAVLQEGVPISHFLDFYESRYKDLMTHKPARSAWFYDKNISIFNTFDIAVSRLKGSQDALELLNLAACFGSRKIPVDLLTDFRISNITTLDLTPLSISRPQKADSHNPEAFKWLDGFVRNQLGFRLAISRLEALCLLKGTKNSTGIVTHFSLHGLTCRWRVETMESNKKEDSILLAACVLSQRLPDIGEQTTSSLYYLPLIKHNQSLVGTYVHANVLEIPEGRFCRPYAFVTARFALVYHQGASAKDAEAMLTATVQYEMVLQESSWPKDQRSLTLLKSLAMVYWKLGKLEDAAEALEILHETSTEHLGEMDDMSIWAAARLRDFRDRKTAYSHYELNAVVASAITKPLIMGRDPSLDKRPALKIEDSATAISDEE